MSQIDRPRLLTILAMILVVSSIGLVSATIGSATVVDADGGGFDSPSDRQSASDDGLDFDFSGESSQGTSSRDGINLQFCVQALQHPLSVFGIVAGVALLVFAMYRRHNVATAGLVSAGLVPVVMFGYFMLTNCQSSGGGGTLLSGSEVLSGSGSTQSPSVPPAVLLGSFAAVMIVAVALLVRMTGDEETFDVVEEDEPEPEAADFARAAGRAADRIEETNADVDNAVYRAWLEMTRLLDIRNPETAAPRDFAEAAIDVGLERDDVFELTELFTEVRYGGESAAGRGDRALTVLRNIEQSYRETVETEEGDR